MAFNGTQNFEKEGIIEILGKKGVCFALKVSGLEP